MGKRASAQVVAINARADRPEDALARIYELLVAKDVRAILLVTVGRDGVVHDPRLYGEATHGELLWASEMLRREALG